MNRNNNNNKKKTLLKSLKICSATQPDPISCFSNNKNCTMAGEKDDLHIPGEIIDKLQSFHQSLEKMREILTPITTTNVNSTDIKLKPLDKARLNLTSGYALNSLFWMYLNTLGINPKEHDIKKELERYKSFMQTVKEISDKDKAPVLNKDAAKRFVRNALWEAKDKDDAASSSAKSAVEVSVREQKRSRYPKDNFRKKKRWN
ncbi:nuclear nucleic acid-binding protein C1D [Nephila pilipes]|uniref:Nuclear nucleic acid-binding protein C1D n=1 Tax=Nephila pilipes TaxID=299642 RepID=A0A8X6PR62_NEPPI|nr:nuclear nucleic acid-binding protein C1D [Nephila pilipes]